MNPRRAVPFWGFRVRSQRAKHRNGLQIGVWEGFLSTLGLGLPCLNKQEIHRLANAYIVFAVGDHTQSPGTERGANNGSSWAAAAALAAASLSNRSFSAFFANSSALGPW
jgi:hypothetical protein